MGCASCKHQEDPAYCDWINYYDNCTQATQQTQATRTAPPTVTPSPAEENEVCPKEDSTTQTSPGDTWEFDRESIVLKSKLGSGKFGEVWKATWNTTTTVVVRALTVSPEEFLEEADDLKNLRHPKLVQVYGICSEKEPVYIVTEFMMHGDLQTYLRDGPGKTLDLPVLVDIAAQVAHGMSFLEKRECIHRNLFAQNIMVGENNLVKIAYFGLKCLQGDSISVRWVAPEAVQREEFSTKSDVWSFGMLLFEIVTKGGLPYPDSTDDDVLKEIEIGRLYGTQKPTNCPDPLYKVMRKCWHINPHDRYTFDFLYSYLDNYFTITLKTRYNDPEVL